MTTETITFGFHQSLSRRHCVHPNSFVQGQAVATGWTAAIKRLSVAI